jgi:DNA-binding CsgD family transcriptional regulator
MTCSRDASSILAVARKVMNEAETLQLIEMIYDSAVAPSGWPLFLKGYAEAMEADLSLIQTHLFAKQRSELLASFGVSVTCQQEYHEYYGRMNPWRRPGELLYQTQRALLGEEIYPFRLLRQSEFYQDYARLAGCAYTATVVLARTQTQATILTAARNERAEPLSEHERRIGLALAPHLSRAWLIQQKLAVCLANETLLNETSIGLVFLSAEGKSVYENLTAETILRDNDGLCIRGGKLHAADPSSESNLQEAIQRTTGGLEAPHAVLVQRRSMKRPYCAILARLQKSVLALAAAPCAVVMISDPERPPKQIGRLLSQLYSLTPREAELTNKLYRGRTVEESAKELNITYETARTHLRRIYDKTGTSGQTDLLLLLGKLPNEALRP